MIFWDIRNPKEILTVFAETLTDSVNSLALRDNYLLAGDEDGLAVVYDLEEKDEMEAVELVLNAEEPIRKIDFFNKDFIFYENYNGIGIFDFELGTCKVKRNFINSVV